MSRGASWMPWLFALAACGFSNTVDGGDPRTETITHVDDTEADFDDGQARDGAVVAPGSIEPDGFVLGGLRARAYQAALLDAGEDFGKLEADAATARQAGAGYAQVPTDWVTSRPRGLGLTTDTAFTVIYDGEILLPKGTVTLEADVDDRALVDLALDGTNFTTRLAAAVDGGPDAITFTVAEPGWYPIRAAITETVGNARFVLAIVQGPVWTVVDANRLRARVTSHRGLIAFAFDGQGFVGERGHTAVATIDEAYGALAPPYDLTASFDRFSLRFAGQLRIDTPGAYSFGANLGSDPNDGWRLWIDGDLVAHRWLSHPDKPVGTVTLAAGWHTLLVDYADEIGNAEIHLAMQGPDAPAGGVIASERLRPVVVHGNTFTFAQTAPTILADASTTIVPLPLPGDATTLIDSVDVGFRIDNQDMSTISVTLFDCAMQPLPVNNVPSYHYYPADKACAGKTTNPAIDWTLRVNDSTAGNAGYIGAGAIRDYGVSALYRGGPKMPWAPVVTYTSGPRATPGALRVDAVRALGSFDGAAVEVAIRTAPDVNSLAARPFEVVRDGVVYQGGDFTQYRVTLTTNGWQYPVLDKVEIAYVVETGEP